MTDFRIQPGEEKLWQLWLDVTQMRSRHSSALLAPRWERLRQTGGPGIDWLQAMQRWEASGFAHDAKPDEFETYVRMLQSPRS